ncbi:hypothetical protein DDZ13_15190 [Coraliomargarita sinensis]|uniref:Uncharacterized protein n=2 Tax=Coraliomargarita sinensis TaxID=2174842 RepID=A0A317ZCV9_9BACT|nr:hypothetical protein DDZ13_15190 [Coraliomargarita sinensis]
MSKFSKLLFVSMVISFIFPLLFLLFENQGGHPKATVGPEPNYQLREKEEILNDFNVYYPKAVLITFGILSICSLLFVWIEEKNTKRPNQPEQDNPITRP